MNDKDLQWELDRLNLAAMYEGGIKIRGEGAGIILKALAAHAATIEQLERDAETKDNRIAYLIRSFEVLQAKLAAAEAELALTDKAIDQSHVMADRIEDLEAALAAAGKRSFSEQELAVMKKAPTIEQSLAWLDKHPLGDNDDTPPKEQE